MDHLEDYKRILAVVRQILPRSESDQEDIAMQVWSEGWERGFTPSRKHIRDRCYDFLRSRRSLGPLPDNIEQPTEEDSHNEEYVAYLMNHSELSPEVRLLIFNRFYMGMSMPEAAKECGISLARANRELQNGLQHLRDLYRKEQE